MSTVKQDTTDTHPAAHAHGGHDDPTAAPGAGADLGLLGALAHGVSAGPVDVQAYDGHVALALDAGILPDMDSTLDVLTTSHHLFDVPVLDLAWLDDGSAT